jgi:hypothetical protein
MYGKKYSCQEVIDSISKKHWVAFKKKQSTGKKYNFTHFCFCFVQELAKKINANADKLGMSVSIHKIFFLRILCRYPQISTSTEGYTVHTVVAKQGNYVLSLHFCSVADPDPVSGAFSTPGSRMGEKSGSGINNPDHFREL